MLILYFLSIIIFVSYIFFIIKKYGILPSISESYYSLPEKLKFLFILFCVFFSVSIISVAHNPLIFFAGSGICFVGTAAQFKKRLPKKVHYFGAISGILFSQLSIFLDFDLLYVNLLFISISSLIFFLRKKYFKNYIWWIEILAFLSILYTIGLSLL